MARHIVHVQVVARNHLVKHRCTREVDVVPTKAHEFLFVAHALGRIRNNDLRSICLAYVKPTFN